MTLRDRISAIFRRDTVPLEPTDAAPRNSAGFAMGEPPAISHNMTVDRIHAALRSAESGETFDLFAIYRDILLGHAHTQNLVNQRKLNVLTKALTFVPADPANPADVKAAEACQILPQTAGWLRVALNHWLNGHLYPLAILEQVYEPAPPNALGLRFRPVGWYPVPYHLIDFTDGQIRLWSADPITGGRGSARSGLVENRHLVHRGHLLTHIPDAWGGPFRAALFWWLFATMDRDWWIRFLDRFGAPFIVGRYDTNDTGSKSTLVKAFSAATRLFGLVVSKETDIAVHAVSTSSHGEAFEKMQLFANAELSKLILGQSMTTTAQAGGLGGSQAGVQENVQASIEAWDLTVLAESVNSEIVGPFLRLNGLTGRAVMQVATDTSAELLNRTKFLEVATKAGLEPTDEAIEVLNKASGLQLRRHGSHQLASAIPTATDGSPGQESASQTPADVQGQAMNGAQVASLVDVVTSVASKGLPIQAALEILKNAFPAIPAASIQAMLQAAASAPPPAPVALSAADVGATDAEATLRRLGQPTDADLDSIAAKAAPDLASAFTGRYAPVRELIRRSTSAAALQRDLAAFFADLPAGRVAQLTEEALTAYSATAAASSFRDKP
jgi:phage gp29-like protein